MQHAITIDNKMFLKQLYIIFIVQFIVLWEFLHPRTRTMHQSGAAVCKDSVPAITAEAAS